jgi:hypothetical protein|tara:strand:+ start:56 stop:238 length:183 start_codon:yes stop_codon:yes gene_type:complete
MKVMTTRNKATCQNLTRLFSMTITDTWAVQRVAQTPQSVASNGSKSANASMTAARLQAKL